MNILVRCGVGKKNNDIETPLYLWEELHNEFKFDHDPCPFKFGPGGKAPDGLSSEWGYRNFVNPPFSSINKWIEKGIIEWKKGKLSVFLIPSRMSSKYWFDYIWPLATEIRIIKGYLVFKGFDHPLPHSMAIIVFEPGVQSLHYQPKRTPHTSYISIKRSQLEANQDLDYEEDPVENLIRRESGDFSQYNPQEPFLIPAPTLYSRMD